jgi:hypothetical protein
VANQPRCICYIYRFWWYLYKWFHSLKFNWRSTALIPRRASARQLSSLGTWFHTQHLGLALDFAEVNNAVVNKFRLPIEIPRYNRHLVATMETGARASSFEAGGYQITSIGTCTDTVTYSIDCVSVIKYLYE